MAWVPRKPASPYCSATGHSVPEVLDDLEGVPDRQHLAAGDVLDVVDERLQVPFVVELDPAGVLGDDLDAVQHRSDLAQTSLELEAVALEPLAEIDLRRRVGIGELDAHDHTLGRLPVEGEPGRVRAAVLHRLEHPRDLRADVRRTVLVNDSGDAAHVVVSRSSQLLGEDVQVFLDVPVAHRRDEPLPLVGLVVHEDPVHVPGQCGLHELVMPAAPRAPRRGCAGSAAPPCPPRSPRRCCAPPARPGSRFRSMPSLIVTSRAAIDR